MSYLQAEQEYLNPPDNEARVAFKCYFCGEDIYEGDDYYSLDSVPYCENCINSRFKYTAEVNDDYEADLADLEYHDLKEYKNYG